MPELFSVLEKQNDCADDMQDPINPPDGWSNPNPGEVITENPGDPIPGASLWGRIHLADKAAVVASKKAEICAIIACSFILNSTYKREDYLYD